MPMYEAGFTYKVEEYGVISIEAASDDDAMVDAADQVKATFPDALDIEIDYVKEITN